VRASRGQACLVRGRANLHQGAVGAAIEFASGTIFRAVIGDGVVWDHPSTGQPLIGERIPHWRQAVETARRCSGALGLGYVRVDIVIDAARGAQVLECNAYPGLVIQNVNTAGLAGRIAQLCSRRAMGMARRPRSATGHGWQRDCRLKCPASSLIAAAVRACRRWRLRR
jgi:hypothetical protein